MDESSQCDALISSPRQLTIDERLDAKKKRLESELAEVNEAIDALQKNPEISRVLSLVGRAVGGIKNY